MRPRRFTLLAALAVAATVLALPTAALADDSVEVTNGRDSGPGSFRAAVEAANADSDITEIEFERRVTVRLLSPVVYDGAQDLEIEGENSRIDGSRGTPATTWDGGLFVSESAANISIEDLTFRNSFNNGIAVFVPAGATGTVKLELHDVHVVRSQFHGIFFDGQASDGYNTDDVPHPACVDPHFVDSAASLYLVVEDSSVRNNGRLDAGFDDSQATGCPRDFDGIRVDDGGPGGITAHVKNTRVVGNLADGIEYDESEDGDVVATLRDAVVSRNGSSGVNADGNVDLDDGFDIDEAGAGSIDATIRDARIRNNDDEGVDFDEEDGGNVTVSISDVRVARNGDEGIKVDEEGSGDLDFSLADARLNRNGLGDPSDAQQQIQLEQADGGNFTGSIVDTIIRNTGFDEDGFKVSVEAESDGAVDGTLTIEDSRFDGDVVLDGIVLL